MATRRRAQYGADERFSIPPTGRDQAGHPPDVRADAARYLHRRGAHDIAEVLGLTAEYDAAAGGQTNG